MALGTLQLLADLDQSGAFATDLSAYWERDGAYSHQGLGRQGELDAAGSASFTLRLDNRDGRFSPENTGSPYYPNWQPYIQIKIKGTYNAVTTDQFVGVIDTLKIGPEPDQQSCHVTARDLMFVLDRTETRLPMMPNQLTGVVIHRLLDYAEVGEIVTNERFETGITGYATRLSSTLTYMTSGDVLHSPGALKVTVPNTQFSGVRYDYTAGTSANQKVYDSAYVKGEDDGIGKTLILRVNDDTGVKGTSSVLTLTDRYQRIEASGTHGASGSRYIDIVTDVAEGVFSFRIGAVHAVPFGNNITRNIDAGQCFLDNPYYHRDTNALRAIQEIRDNEGLAIFYFNGSGQACFEDRHHRWKGDHLTSTLNLGERGKIDYTQAASDRVNEVVFDYPRYVTASPSQVWSLDRVPIEIGPSASFRVEADFGGGLVRDPITPVANTDFAVMSAAEAGVDESANVTLTMVAYGGGATVTIQNNVARRVYLTSLVIRGTSIREASDLTPVRYEPAGGVALGATLSHSFRWNSREPYIQSLAEYYGDRYVTQRSRIAITINSAWPEYAIAKPELTHFFARQVSDRITLSNTTLPFSTKVAGDFYIDRIDRTITGVNTAATYRLTPVDDVTYARTGVSNSNGTDSHQTAP